MLRAASTTTANGGAGENPESTSSCDGAHATLSTEVNGLESVAGGGGVLVGQASGGASQELTETQGRLLHELMNADTRWHTQYQQNRAKVRVPRHAGLSTVLSRRSARPRVNLALSFARFVHSGCAGSASLVRRASSGNLNASYLAAQSYWFA